MQGALAAGGRGKRLAALLAALAFGCVGEPGRAPPPEPTPLQPASLSGRLVAEAEALSSADFARTVVYLEPIPAPRPASAPRSAELRHRSARLAPDLLAVAPGDVVWLVNDDRIFHGAFSYSRPNAFDLGAYGPGERRQIRLSHRGAVRVHCPFHPEETSLVFVAPTRLVARPARNGAYEITGAAAGRYWLRAWADGLPEIEYDVTLHPGEAAFRDIVWARDAAPNAAGAGGAAEEEETGPRAPPPPAAARRPGSPGSRGSPTQ